MAIESLEEIQAGDSSQWIRVRGADASNPVLLLIQQGPGLPMINEARRFGHLLGLEQAATPEWLHVPAPAARCSTGAPAPATRWPPATDLSDVAQSAGTSRQSCNARH